MPIINMVSSLVNAVCLPEQSGWRSQTLRRRSYSAWWLKSLYSGPNHTWAKHSIYYTLCDYYWMYAVRSAQVQTHTIIFNTTSVDSAFHIVKCVCASLFTVKDTWYDIFVSNEWYSEILNVNDQTYHPTLKQINICIHEWSQIEVFSLSWSGLYLFPDRTLKEKNKTLWFRMKSTTCPSS